MLDFQPLFGDSAGFQRSAEIEPIPGTRAKTKTRDSLTKNFLVDIACCFVYLSAVNSMDTAMGLSIYSTYSLEDVARESPNTIKFMQMQFYTDRQLMVEVLKRAEKAGFKAVLLTVDIPVYGQHRKRANFFLPEHLNLGNFLSLKKRKGLRNNRELSKYISDAADSSVDWETFDWLRSTTSLPFVVKGILTAEDARLAVQHGAQGIMVSNHGGRQLDCVPATVCALVEKLFQFLVVTVKYRSQAGIF